jgi:hypothetical protein
MVILTPDSTASENVKDEIRFAIDNGKRTLPILLENAIVPLHLRRFQYVDFTTKSYEDNVGIICVVVSIVTIALLWFRFFLRK